MACVTKMIMNIRIYIGSMKEKIITKSFQNLKFKACRNLWDGLGKPKGFLE